MQCACAWQPVRVRVCMCVLYVRVVHRAIDTTDVCRHAHAHRRCTSKIAVQPPLMHVCACLQPGQARAKRLTSNGQDAGGAGATGGGGAPATMSRAGVKAQPAVRRAGPAPVPGGEDWWAEVEAVSGNWNRALPG